MHQKGIVVMEDNGYDQVWGDIVPKKDVHLLGAEPGYAVRIKNIS